MKASNLAMKFYLGLLLAAAFVFVAVAAQANEADTDKLAAADSTNEGALCSLNKLINDLCTQEDDIACRRCYFKTCHNPGPFFIFSLLPAFLRWSFKPLIFHTDLLLTIGARQPNGLKY